MDRKDYSFFDKLKLVFSTNAITSVNSKGERTVIDVERRQQVSNLTSRLVDRYTRLHRGQYDGYQYGVSMSYLQNRLMLYRDYDAMDSDPILASALDIISDECLGGNTVIPLLNGEKKTISELYSQGYTNFWLYGLDSSGNMIPVKAERVAYNGKKLVRRITLDDGTVIFATDNHVWVTPNMDFVTTKDLVSGCGIYTLNTKLSSHGMYRVIRKSGHSTFTDFINTTNHKVYDVSHDYFEMDVYDIVNAGDTHVYAIETNNGGKLYTHNCTTKDEYGDVLQIKSSNSQVKDALHNLFYDVLNVEFNLWPWTRNLVKYGDFFLGLEIKEGEGITNAFPQSVYYTERIEGSDPHNPDYVKFKVEMDRFGKTEWENYEMAHFRLLSDTNFLPYGKSFIENGRKVWKQLCLAGDSKVWTDRGHTPISDIKDGDVVYSYDYSKNLLVPTTVKHHVRTGTRPVYEIKTGHRTIRGTEEHPIMVSGGCYKNIGDLTTDDYVVVVGGVGYDFLVDNGVMVERVTSITEFPPTDVYDIEVDNDLHNFIVDGVIAHNCLMEDAMLIHRIMRAPEKRVFRIDIGNINPTEVDNYMQKIINKMKKVPVIDKATGDYNLRYNMQNLTEDFYLPVRGGDSGTSIDSLNGLEYSAIEDIEYLLNKLFASLKIPKAYLSYDESVNGKCISPHTLIPLIDGSTKTVDQLIVDYKSGIKNYVYSIDESTNNIVPGEIEWVGYTRLNAQVVRVWLDNDKYIECTPDHKFLTRDNQWIEAQYLEIGQPLMPLYLRDGGYKNRYTKVYQPSTGKYELVHKIVSKHYDMLSDGKVVHHIDFNSRNNNPENLDCSMTFWEHRSYHSKYNHMPLSHTNKQFIKTYPLDKYHYKNHTVKLVEWVDTKIDTCDLTVKAYHNFATDAGVIIHNSTLAAEDIRFARTIERVQRTIVSELNKIAIVHLVSSGFTVDELSDFELSLTNPSTIYEQEKISLWSEKMTLANDIKDSNLLSLDWIYNNIFNFTLDEADVERAKILTDLKLKQRYASIENEGKDPFAEDLEKLANTEDTDSYESKDKGGRPKEITSYRSDEHPRGRDPIGDRERKSPRTRESATSKANKSKIVDQYLSRHSRPKTKTMLNESSSLLDENNIIDDEI